MNMNTPSFPTRIRLKMFNYPREITIVMRLTWRKGVDTV
jgi:hypothetical protein